MQAIKEIMKKEHETLKGLFEDFEKQVNNSDNLESAKKTFSRFKWQLQKHFFIEEKAVCTGFKEKQDNLDIEGLFKQHENLIQMLSEIEDAIDENQKPEIQSFKHSILDHADFEDDFFYPKLDDILDENQKQEIIERCREIIKD